MGGSWITWIMEGSERLSAIPVALFIGEIVKLWMNL